MGIKTNIWEKISFQELFTLLCRTVYLKVSLNALNITASKNFSPIMGRLEKVFLFRFIELFKLIFYTILHRADEPLEFAITHLLPSNHETSIILHARKAPMLFRIKWNVDSKKQQKLLGLEYRRRWCFAVKYRAFWSTKANEVHWYRYFSFFEKYFSLSILGPCFSIKLTRMDVLNNLYTNLDASWVAEKVLESSEVEDSTLKKRGCY